MVNNVSFSVTNKCNCQCKICNIWQTPSFDNELSVAEIDTLFSNPGFVNVDTISFTGGEPFLRNDFMDIIRTCKARLPNLNRIFLNTNATCPEKVMDICKECATIFNETILSISLDGRPEIHNLLRGVPVYNRAIQLIQNTKSIPNLKLSLSMTLSGHNCNIADLEHVHQIANTNGCMFSFRFADKSTTYYKNSDVQFGITSDAKQQVSRYIQQNCSGNSFLLVLKHFIDTGRVPLLQEGDSNKCLAGKHFVFIHPNGDIAPCLYSTQKISLEQLNAAQKIQLGKQEPCPCCTDCAIYPILEHLQKLK